MAASDRTLGDAEREVAFAGFLASCALCALRLAGAPLPWLAVTAPMWVPQTVRGLLNLMFVALMWRWWR